MIDAKRDPLRIAIAGAPGSGKTELAIGIARALETQGGRYQPVTIIDDYVSGVERDLDLACGFLGSHLADMAIAVARYGQEREALREGAQTTITCGTLAETAAYTAINVTLAQNEWGWAVANVAMPYYALMAANVMGYDLVLRVPLLDPDAPEIYKALDREIVGSFNALKVRYKDVSADDVKWRVVEAMTLIPEESAAA